MHDFKQEKGTEGDSMKSNVFILSLLAGFGLPIFFCLGFFLNRNGFGTAALVVYVLGAAVAAWAVWRSRCPDCGWPLVLDIRHYKDERRAGCPCCGSTKDVEL